MMGTRSTTSFYDGDTHLLTYYRQYDGYPTFYGSQLAKFIRDIKIVNGFTPAMEGGTHANGVPCLVAQILVHFKTNDGLIGGLYIQSEATKNQEAYHYDVVFDDDDKCSITVFQYGENVGTFTPAKLVSNAVRIEEMVEW